jgi:hypothetical protein
MSVGSGFIAHMAATPTDTTTATGGEVVVPRRRGKSKAPNFKYDGPVSVIRLELDASDERTRRGLQRHWDTVFWLRRALQRDAAARCRAYWAAHRERGCDRKALRERLGLSHKGIEARAKGHIEASGWMRSHVTKALGLHVADEVGETIDRHLFADASRRRHRPPRIGSWWDFTRIPGRARSHTKTTPVWETYRLVGTLGGHLGTYRHRLLPAAVSSAVAAAARPGGSSILAQPARLRAPDKPASGSWSDHTAALAMVFTGLAGDAVGEPDPSRVRLHKLCDVSDYGCPLGRVHRRLRAEERLQVRCLRSLLRRGHRLNREDVDASGVGQRHVVARDAAQGHGVVVAVGFGQHSHDAVGVAAHNDLRGVEDRDSVRGDVSGQNHWQAQQLGLRGGERGRDVEHVTVVGAADLDGAQRRERRRPHHENVGGDVLPAHRGQGVDQNIGRGEEVRLGGGGDA